MFFLDGLVCRLGYDMDFFIYNVLVIFVGNEIQLYFIG